MAFLHGDYDRAVSLYNGALTGRPNDPDLTAGLADVLLHQQRSGNPANARAEIEKLNKLKNALRQTQQDYDWSTQIEVQRLAALAWVEHAEGDQQSALHSMRAAADLENGMEKHPVTPGPVLPARELLGELLMELDQPARALPEFERVLQNSPNRFNCGLWRCACGRAWRRSKEGRRTLFGVASGMQAF